MSGINIEYFIEQKGKISPTDGKIDNILQKNSQGFRIQDAQLFQFNIKLKSKAIVSMVEFKSITGQTIEIELFEQGRKSIDVQKKQLISHKPDWILFNQSKERKKVTTRLKIEITNKSSPLLGAGLVYLLVKGEKMPDDKGKTISRQVKDRQYFDDARMSVHRKPVIEKGKEIFDKRKKARNQNKIASQLENLDRSYNEDQQMKRAIEKSKQEMRLQPKNEKRQRKSVYQKEQTSMSYLNQPREYTKVDFQRYKQIFQHVNSEWLTAQRNQEIKRGIKEEDRLSNAIQVKHFHNKRIFIDMPSPKKIDLEKLSERMGAKILREPQDYCIFITNRIDTQKVAKAKKLKHIKILKPNFIQDCERCNAFLDEKDYYHKL